MKQLAALCVALTLASPALAQPTRPGAGSAPPDVRLVAPALADYTDDVLFGDVWLRKELGPRDRSLVTVTALITGGNTAQMIGHLNRALGNGVKPAEISAVIRHLASYVGAAKATAAADVARQVFLARGVSGDLPTGAASYTPAGDPWRLTDLSPRDRSLVTIATLIASGGVDALQAEMERGLANGLTRSEVSEEITHLAFYSGWPRAMSAIPAAKAAFAKAP